MVAFHILKIVQMVPNRTTFRQYRWYLSMYERFVDTLGSEGLSRWYETGQNQAA